MARIEITHDELQRADGAVNTLTFAGIPGVSRGSSLDVLPRALWTEDKREIAYVMLPLLNRVVNEMVDGATLAGWTVCLDDDTDAASDVDERYQIRSKVAEWIFGARLNEGALLVMVTAASATDGEPGTAGYAGAAEPMRDSEKVQSLQVYAGDEIVALSWGDDPESPWYRDVLTWQITPANGSGTIVVHASRCAYLPGSRMPRRWRYRNGGKDLSIIELYRMAVLRRDSFDGSVATILHSFDAGTLSIPGLRATLVGNPTEASKFVARQQTFARQMGNDGIGLLDKEEVYERHPFSATGIAEADQATRQSVSMVEGWPQKVIYGDSPGGLTSDDAASRKQRAVVIARYQGGYLNEPLSYIYARLLGVERGEVQIEFAPTEPMSVSERATVELTLAQRDVALEGVGAITPEQIAGRIDSDEISFVYPEPAMVDDLLDGADPEQEPVDPNAPPVVPDPEADPEES